MASIHELNILYLFLEVLYRETGCIHLPTAHAYPQ